MALFRQNYACAFGYADVGSRAEGGRELRYLLNEVLNKEGVDFWGPSETEKQCCAVRQAEGRETAVALTSVRSATHMDALDGCLGQEWVERETV